MDHGEILSEAKRWVTSRRCVVLVACSQRKRLGGSSWSAPLVPGLLDQLPSAEHESVLVTRSSLAGFCGIARGPDVGGKDIDGRYLPADTRYDGRLYGRIDHLLWPLSGDQRVIIVSALYGLLFTWEPIQHYDLTMKSSLQRKLVGRRWREVGLGRIVARWCAANAVVGVIDLLSQPYRYALHDLKDLHAVGAERLAFEYPGRYQAGNLDRGDDLQTLLQIGDRIRW